MDRDAEQQLLEEAEAISLEQLDWWKPNEDWWNQDQQKLREWHDDQLRSINRWK